jgi:orotidine-5'-phosphate decarboxylase
VPNFEVPSYRPVEPKDRLIFALDVDHYDDAERLVKQLASHVGMFKVGPRLFLSAGAQVLDLIHNKGSSVFLDLKLHDIPESVAGAVREIARQRVKMFTVHGLGGPKMIGALLRELSMITVIPGLRPPICLAVTILTSHQESDLAALGFHEPLVELVKRIGKLALDAGAEGLVASGHELSALRQISKDAVFVVPGIRGPGDAIGDQSRVMTAREAVEAGATWVVVGRPIRNDKDPAGAAQRIVADIAMAKPVKP